MKRQWLWRSCFVGLFHRQIRPSGVGNQPFCRSSQRSPRIGRFFSLAGHFFVVFNTAFKSALIVELSRPLTVLDSGSAKVVEATLVCHNPPLHGPGVEFAFSPCSPPSCLGQMPELCGRVELMPARVVRIAQDLPFSRLFQIHPFQECRFFLQKYKTHYNLYSWDTFITNPYGNVDWSCWFLVMMGTVVAKTVYSENAVWVSWNGF